MRRDEKAIRRYIGQTKKFLLIPRKEKRAIIDGFRQELLDFSEAGGGCAYETLAANFGEPHDAARELMENAGLEENGKTARRRRILLRAVIAVLAILLVGLTCELVSVLRSQEISVTEVIYELSDREVRPEEIQLGRRQDKTENINDTNSTQ